MPKEFKAIAAMSLNRVIGRDNKLPWHIPGDLKWFKKITTGHVIVMGRATWESIGRALPNRETVVVSRQGISIPGVKAVRSLDELDLENDPREYFLVGGAQLFEAGLARCSDLYLTLVKREVEGDVFFPPFEANFERVEKIDEQEDFVIWHYRRKSRCLKSLYFAGPAEIAAFAAKRLVEAVRQKKAGQPFGIALSGGRIAQPFFEGVVRCAKQENLDWAEVHFFWADERCVPPDDPESSYAIARDHLLGPLKVDPQNIHRILGEADPEFAAEQAEAELCRIMPLNEEGQPVLDLVILGMGEDGHVASLFPEESGTEGPQVYRPVIATKPPPKRVTISYATIAAAANAWVLASGEGKREAYAGLLRGDTRLPIVRVVKSRSEVLFLQDFAADEEKIERSGAESL